MVANRRFAMHGLLSLPWRPGACVGLHCHSGHCVRPAILRPRSAATATTAAGQAVGCLLRVQLDVVGDWQDALRAMHDVH